MTDLNSDLFFDTAHYAHRAFFANGQAWETLAGLKDYMDSQPYQTKLLAGLTNGTPLAETMVLVNDTLISGQGLDIDFGDATKGKLLVTRNGATIEDATVLMAGAVLVGGKIRLGKGVLVESGAFLKGPLLVGDRCEIRHGAYLRGYCLIGARCVVGHTTEVKHSIFLDDAKAGHFAYVGDSILGNQVNLGAGTKLANFRFMPGNVRIKTDAGHLDSGLRKLGALLGDGVQTGCNSVTSPGTLLAKKTMVMPNVTVPSGYHAKSIIR